MDERPLGSTGYDVTEVGMGTWNIGGDWGDVSDGEGREAIRAALDTGVTFLDTADVYGDGRSERLISEVLADREEEPVVATKAGRRLDPHEAAGYNEANLRRFVDRSRGILGVDTLDLVQLHCPPTDAYYQPGTFEALATLRDEGRIDHDAVSTVIPGSTTPGHVRENVAAADLPRLPAGIHAAVREVYDEYVREHVHHRW